MTTLISDTETYKNLNRDPTLKIQKQLNSVLKTIFDKGHINWFTYDKLTSHNGVSPKIYGLPKIHKTGTPFRPIVSFVQSPTYNSASHLSTILRKIKKIEKYNIKNSYKLKEELQRENVPDGFSLVSFDVVSLFTSIDVQLAIDEIMLNWPEIQKHTAIEKLEFEQLLTISATSGYFSFDDKIYKQEHGTPMGSPLSPVLADVIMDKVLDHVMERVGDSINYICKYVDDIFAIAETEKIPSILETFHSYHPSLKFTYETEQEDRLSFLETIVTHRGRKLDIDWYQKPTATNRVLNYHSNHPAHQKSNTAENLIRRATTICSNKYKKRNLKKAQLILKENSYPDNIINRITSKAMAKKPASQHNDNETTANNKITYKPLTYIKGVTEKIAGAVKSTNEKTKIAMKANRNYKSIKSVTKDQVPLLMKSNLIYRIPCSECDLCYVGQTSQYLKERVHQHETCKQRTAVFIHKEEPPRHTLNFDQVEILQHENYKHQREFLEMLHINNNDTINIKTDTIGINKTYKPLLRTLRQKKFV
jgi:hypothetical protein